MRVAIGKNGWRLEVIEHIMTKNLWEYFIIKDHSNDDDIKLAYVMGFESEMGSVSINEMKPYIISRTAALDEILPPEGFDWESSGSFSLAKVQG